MACGFKVGQCIEGKLGTYVLSKQLHKDIWTATYKPLPIDRSPSSLTLNRSSNLGKVVIKSAPKQRLDNERDVLKHFHARPGIRQLLDETQDPPSLVLKPLDDNLLNAPNSKRFEKLEIKLIAKGILEALQAFHKVGYVHTGMALLRSLCLSLLLYCSRF
jgi:casein kinase II subunit alpha